MHAAAVCLGFHGVGEDKCFAVAVGDLQMWGWEREVEGASDQANLTALTKPHWLGGMPQTTS